MDEAERDRLAMVAKGRRLKSGRPKLLGEWALECAEREAPNKEPGTVDTDESIRLRHINTAPIARMRLKQITRQDCQDWVNGLRKWENIKKPDGTRELVKTDQRHAPTTVRRIASVLARFMELAVEDELIASNPMVKVRLPKVYERQNRVLSPTEAASLISWADRTAAMITVLVLTGMRRSELARLEWKHVEIDYLWVPGKKNTAAAKRIPLHEIARQAIDSQPRRGSYVFSVASGGQMSVRNITRDISERLSQFEGMRPQDLRGSFVSLLLESGADIRAVMELARHSNPRTTLKMYARSRQETHVAAIEGLGKKIQLVDQNDRVRKKG